MSKLLSVLSFMLLLFVSGFARDAAACVRGAVYLSESDSNGPMQTVSVNQPVLIKLAIIRYPGSESRLWEFADDSGYFRVVQNRVMGDYDFVTLVPEKVGRPDVTLTLTNHYNAREWFRVTLNIVASDLPRQSDAELLSPCKL